MQKWMHILLKYWVPRARVPFDRVALGHLAIPVPHEKSLAGCVALTALGCSHRIVVGLAGTHYV